VESHSDDLEESPPAAELAPDTLAQAAAARDRRFQDLVAAVLDGPGVLPHEVRKSLAVGGAAPVPEPLARLAAKVADGGLTVTDDDIAALLAAGSDEDAVFECVVAAAVAAGRVRLQTVERLLAASP